MSRLGGVKLLPVETVGGETGQLEALGDSAWDTTEGVPSGITPHQSPDSRSNF